jgi:hypothetical protein
LFRHILYLSAYYFRGIRFWYTGVILSWFPWTVIVCDCRVLLGFNYC